MKQKRKIERENLDRNAQFQEFGNIKCREQEKKDEKKVLKVM